MGKATIGLFVALLSVVAASACDGEPKSFRNYAYHLELDDEQASGLWAACPTDDKSPLTVRWLADQGQAGVDVRVEFSDYMSEARAACVWAYLTSHGSKEFETDTQFWPPDDGGGTQSDLSTTGGGVPDPSTTGGTGP